MNKKQIMKDTLILLIITLVSGGLLGYVYDLTKEPIENQEIQAQVDAYNKVMDADHFEEEYQSEITKSASELDDYGTKGLEVLNALTAYQNDEIAGYVIQIVDHDGFNGDIELIVGIDREGIITGIEILTISETAGLGMNATNEEFLNQYIGKIADQFVVTKTESQNDNEIDALTGATITSNAMTDGINGALQFYALYMEGREMT